MTLEESLQTQIKFWQQRAEKAEACVAEMRDALSSARCSVCELRNDAIRNGVEHGDIDERLAAVDHALSNNCGKGWLSPEKVKVLVEALERIVRGCEDDVNMHDGRAITEISYGEYRQAVKALSTLKGDMPQ